MIAAFDTYPSANPGTIATQAPINALIGPAVFTFHVVDK